MKKFEQNTLLRIYNKGSIIVGLSLLLSLFLYFAKLPDTMNGVVEKGLFKTTYTVALSTNVVAFNSALVFALIILVLNIAFAIYSFSQKTNEKAISESTVYNSILSIALVAALVIFYVNIPESVNGTIFIGFFQYKFDVLSDVVVGGFNFAYAIVTVYFVYNLVVAYLSTIAKDPSSDK